MREKEIKHIVFDLGGVIVNLNTRLTINGFASLSSKPVEEIANDAMNNSLFHEYEKGLIDNTAFRERLKDLLEIDYTDAAIDQAWNAMIIDIPEERLQWLKALKEDYKVTILSNTNDIHISYVHELLSQNHQLEDFSSLADQVYYSHKINLRKPDADIYEYVLSNASHSPEETLFLDDNLDNIKAAEEVGIQTIHVINPKFIPTLLNNEGIQF